MFIFSDDRLFSSSCSLVRQQAYDFSDVYQFAGRANTSTNLRRVNGKLVEVEGTGGVVQTSKNFAEYRITAMEDITTLPDTVQADAIKIQRNDWKVSDNVTGSMAESMVFDSARRKVCFGVRSVCVCVDYDE